MTLYHISNPTNRDSILINGLIPQIGDSQRCNIDNPQPRIYMCLHNHYDSTYDDDRWLIKVTDLTLTDDPDVKGGVYTTEPVQPNNLILLHKGTGESTF